MPKTQFSIAEMFSRTPGARLRRHGPHSAQELREEHLAPLIKDCVRKHLTLSVSLDGVEGFAASFLEEAFAGLVRCEGILKEDLQRTLEVTSQEIPSYRDEVLGFIEDV